MSILEHCFLIFLAIAQKIKNTVQICFGSWKLNKSGVFWMGLILLFEELLAFEMTNLSVDFINIYEVVYTKNFAIQ